MPELNYLIKEIIPGIADVSDADIDLFFDSPEGLELNQLISRGHFDTSRHLFSTGYSSALSPHGPSSKSSKISAFQNKIKESISFITLRSAIIQTRLQCFFEYQFLSQADQALLANTPYSTAFYTSRDKKRWIEAMENDTDIRVIQIRNQIHSHRSQLLRQARDQMGCIVSHSIQSDVLYPIVQTIYHPKRSTLERKTTLEPYLKPFQYRNAIWNQPDQHPAWWSVYNALSYITEHVGISNVKEYMNRIADAHTFYQFFGLTNEHGGWQLDYLDLYNYNRNQENISTLKAIFYALISPLHAFFHEYVQIARYEKNQFNIMIRALIPILIVSLFLVCIFSFMAPLAISELLEFLFFFPALYAAIGAASAYVELKNQTYTAFISFWWGDLYQTPAFQVNARLLTSFNDPTLAQSIADFYICALKECDLKEQEFALIPKGTLTTSQLNDRKNNFIRKSTLLLEWYDLHSHEDLGCDETPMIIKKRLYTDGLSEHEQLKSNTTRYADRLIEEVDMHLKPNRNEPTAATSRWPFFSLEQQTRKLGQQCTDHQEKLTRIESIYSQLGKEEQNLSRPLI